MIKKFKAMFNSNLERILIFILILSMVISIAGIVVMIHNLTTREDVQIVDCWVGDEIQTPNVSYTVGYAVSGRFCEIIPPQNFDF